LQGGGAIAVQVERPNPKAKECTDMDAMHRVFDEMGDIRRITV
jgi:hypothetical protein